MLYANTFTHNCLGKIQGSVCFDPAKTLVQQGLGCLSFGWTFRFWLLPLLVLRQNNMSVWEEIHVHVVRELTKLVRVDWRKNDRLFDNFFFPRHCGIPQRTTTIILPEKGKKNISQQQHFPKN